MDGFMEVFALFGAPARIFGRIPLIMRYACTGLSDPWIDHQYARERYGPSYRIRPWLLFDIGELRMIEQLINKASDKTVSDFRKNQLEQLHMVSVVGALIAAAALTTMQLPGITDCSYVVRGCFTVTLTMALFATFFTSMLKRVYGFIEEPSAIRTWLSNGTEYQSSDGGRRRRSSTVSHQLMQVPFELLCISMTAFLLGIGVYFGSAMAEHLDLGSGDERIGNRGVLLTYAVTSAFALGLLGQLLGCKDIENRRSERAKLSPIEVEETYSYPLPTIPTSPTNIGTKTVFQLGISEVGNSAELAKAIHNAVEAHRKCAVAMEEVARMYERML